MTIKRPLCLLCLIFMVVIWVMQISGLPDSRQPREKEIVSSYLQEHSQVVRIYGQIYKRSFDKSAYHLKNSYLQVQSQVISLKNVKVYMKEEAHFPIGCGVVLTGKLQEIPKAGNPGQFDSVLYYETQNISYRMVNASGTIKEMPRWSYRETLAKVRDLLFASLETAGQTYAPIYEAMLLGDKSNLEAEVKDRYQMAGMLHMLAISGMHLSLLGMGCFSILQRMGASIPLGGSISVCLLFSYGILTGESAATMRALCMFVVVMGAKITGRTYDLLSAMSLSAVFLLINSPSYLFYSGFLLSFGCICGVGIVLPCLEQIFSLKKQNPKHKKWSVALVNALAGSFAIQMATLPITLYFFYEIPVYGILLNLIALPALSVVLVCAVMGSLAGLFAPGFAAFVLLPGNIILQVYDWLGLLAQRLPMTTWVAGQPQKWQVAVYYVLTGAALWYGNTFIKKREKKGRLRVLLLIIWVGCIGLFAMPCTKGLCVTCLDVGQGDCAVVVTKQQTCHLIDGGSSNVSEVGRYRILPYLKSQGISTVDYAWVSHTDSDHISGILEILQLQAEHRSSVRIQNLMLPDWAYYPENYEELQKAAQKADVKVHTMGKGDSLREGEVTWSVLQPDTGQGEDVNEDSQVLLLEAGTFQALFTGDIGTKAEERMAEMLKDIDFLKVAHHGSRYSTGEAFLRKTKPEIAVISCSSTNRYGHPSSETIERLEQEDCRIWYTMKSGAVTVRVKDTKLQVEPFLEES